MLCNSNTEKFNLSGPEMLLNFSIILFGDLQSQEMVLPNIQSEKEPEKALK